MESEPMLTREKSWEDFLDKTHVDHELMTQLVKGYLTSEGFHDISQIMDEEAKEIGFAEKNESCEPTELQKIQRSVSTCATCLRINRLMDRFFILELKI